MQMLMWVWFSAWWRLSKTTQFYWSPKKVKDRLQRSTVSRHMTHSKKLSTDTCSVTCERPDRCVLPDGRVACRAAGPPAGPGSWAWSRWRPWWGSFQTDGRRGRSPPHYELKHHTHKHTCVIYHELHKRDITDNYIKHENWIKCKTWVWMVSNNFIVSVQTMFSPMQPNPV